MGRRFIFQTKKLLLSELNELFYLAGKLQVNLKVIKVARFYYGQGNYIFYYLIWDSSELKGGNINAYYARTIWKTMIVLGKLRCMVTVIGVICGRNKGYTA